MFPKQNKSRWCQYLAIYEKKNTEEKKSNLKEAMFFCYEIMIV